MSSKQERKSLRRQFGLPDNRFVIACVARLQPQKGIEYLIKSVALAKDQCDEPITLVIAGDSHNDAYKEKITDQISELDLSDTVVMPGNIQKVPELLSCADAYVHSAIWEGFPVSVLEGMAAELPTVFTDCAGVLPGFAKGVHGYLSLIHI